MNWMLPLETLPGWPEAPAVSPSHMVFLMVLGPLAVGAIMTLLAFTPALGRRFRGELATGTPHSEEHAALEPATAPARAAIAPHARRADSGPDA